VDPVYSLQEHVKNGLLGDGVVRHHTLSQPAGGDLSANIPRRGIKGRLSLGGEAA
jgi:hypothetical protein